MPIFSTNLRKLFIVKNATKAEPKNPVRIINKSFNSNEKAPFKNINIKAPKIVGMLSKNANFDVSFRFKPISNAPVTVSYTHMTLPTKRIV